MVSLFFFEVPYINVILVNMNVSGYTFYPLFVLARKNLILNFHYNFDLPVYAFSLGEGEDERVVLNSIMHLFPLNTHSCHYTTKFRKFESLERSDLKRVQFCIAFFTNLRHIF